MNVLTFQDISSLEKYEIDMTILTCPNKRQELSVTDECILIIEKRQLFEIISLTHSGFNSIELKAGIRFPHPVFNFHNVNCCCVFMYGDEKHLYNDIKSVVSLQGALALRGLLTLK